MLTMETAPPMAVAAELSQCSLSLPPSPATYTDAYTGKLAGTTEGTTLGQMHTRKVTK